MKTCAHDACGQHPLTFPGCCRRDALSKLAVHVEIASRVNAAVNSAKLAEISALEQAIGETRGFRAEDGLKGLTVSSKDVSLSTELTLEPFLIYLIHHTVTALK